MSRATYSLHSTPVGVAVLAMIDDSLVALSVVPTPDDAPTAEFARRFGIAPELVALPKAIARQFDDYFSGHRRRFDLPLDWRFARGFARDALQAVIEIPYGETASYGEVAAAAGRPRAARAVGTACARTPFALIVPVHRVVRADGSLGEYGGRPEVKRFLLQLEGHALTR